MLVIVVTFPLSVFFCVKVCNEYTSGVSAAGMFGLQHNRWFKNTKGPLFSGWVGY